MTTLKNNPVIDQFRIVLSKAIDLKEQFDSQKENEILLEYATIYATELDKLVRISPSEIFRKTHLLRHSGWLQRYLSKGEPQNCYADIQEICHNDLHLTEEFYFHFLADNNEVPEKYYDWQNVNPVIRNLCRSRVFIAWLLCVSMRPCVAHTLGSLPGDPSGTGEEQRTGAQTPADCIRCY